MRTQRIDTHGAFILSDGDHAVTFRPTTRFIGWHSTEAPGNVPPPLHECEYLHDAEAYCDGSGSAGVAFMQRWEAGGYGNDVVWAELDEWFNRYFPAAA